MTWINIGLIPTTEDWQYTEPFEGDYIKLRYLFGVEKENLPYGFTGLMAQAFNFSGDIEHYDVRKLYPSTENVIFPVINPFPGRSRRLGIRGQRRYQTSISWQVYIDAWVTPDTIIDLPDPLETKDFDSTNLVGEWDLNNNVSDSSPDGTDNNSGILTGSTAFVANADFGNTLRFEGNGYLEIPNTEDINLGNHAKRTVSVWFNATDSQPRQTIFEEGGVVRGLNIYLDQRKVYFGGWNEPDNETAWKGTFLSADLSDGWHLATLTLDATLWKMKTEPNTFKAYLDGQEIGKGSGSQLWGHGDPTAFGGVAGATLFHDGSAFTGSYLMGEIAKPKIFNRALSASEIQNLYNNFS